MLILGIESTCDETAAAVVKDGTKVLSNVVASSVDLQNKYGGVVPEVAAREQIKVIIPVINEALVKAFGSIRNNNSYKSAYPIDAIAVSHGPGLIGSLLIGVETAKALALAWDKPLIPVNHLVGHIYANWLQPIVNSEWSIVNRRQKKSIHHLPFTINFPLVGLVVSGGHTDLVLMKGHGEFKLIGTTLDDSAGEAFDKVARLLGLGYPGGPDIERLASQIRSTKSEIRNIRLPRPMINSKDFNFSFSGLKTAVVNRVKSPTKWAGRQGPRVKEKAEIAQEFQKAIADVLVKKSVRAAQQYQCKTIVIGGGVAANELLRSQLTVHGSRIKIPVLFPSKKLAVDNGAMIAAAAYFIKTKVSPQKLIPDPGLHF